MITLTCRDTFSRLAKLQKSNPVNPFFAVASVVIVGGLLDKHWIEPYRPDNKPLEPEDMVLNQSDQDRLFECVKNVMRLGIRFDASVINLCNLKYGDDYVTDQPSADLLILGYINKNMGRESDALEEGKSWEDALRKGKPKLIYINSDNGETTVTHRDIPKEMYMRASKAENCLFDGEGLYIRRDLLSLSL